MQPVGSPHPTVMRANLLFARCVCLLGLVPLGYLNGLAAPPATTPAQLQRKWDFQMTSRTPEAWNGVTVRTDPAVNTPDGGPTLRLTAQVSSENLEWPAFINCWTNIRDVRPGARITASFWLRGDKGVTVDVGAVTERHFVLCERQSFPQDGVWHKVEFTAPLGHQTGLRWVALPRITLRKVEAGQTVHVGPIEVNVQ